MAAGSCELHAQCFPSKLAKSLFGQRSQGLRSHDAHQHATATCTSSLDRNAYASRSAVRCGMLCLTYTWLTLLSQACWVHAMPP